MSSYRVPVLMMLPGGEGRGRMQHTGLLARRGADDSGAGSGENTARSSSAAIFFTPTRSKRRAVMQHNHDVALLDAQGRMVVLGYGKTMWGFELNAADQQLAQLNQPDPDMVQDVAAFFQSAFQLYYATAGTRKSRDGCACRGYTIVSRR